MRIRALRSIAGDRNIDEARVDLAQFLIAKAVFLRRAGAKVLTEDVSFRDQLFEDIAAFRFLEV
jgi:hypothetical protein